MSTRTYLLHVDAVTGTAEDQTRLHRFGESLSLRNHQHMPGHLLGSACLPEWKSLLGLLEEN